MFHVSNPAFLGLEMSSSTTDGQIGLRWRNFRRSQSTSQVDSTHHDEQEEPREDWISLISLCCSLDIHIFNPVSISIKTRSARGKNSGIARQGPTDFRGRNAVLKFCYVKKDLHGVLEYDFQSLIKETLIFAHPSLQAHANIARLMGLMWEEDSMGSGLGIGPVLVLEFADMGTLLEVAEREPFLQFLDKVELSLGVGEAITALHECGIIHGDLKLENVLVQTSSEGKIVPKLTDFDLSLISPTISRRLPGGTYPWNAPEYREELCPDRLILTDVFS
jgi:serine/threonine protein kinase